MSVLEGWQAARVVRKHTLPHIRQENIAEHTWGVLHILLSIYPNVPTIILKGALYHDLGEHKSGDIPGDFKADNPEIREHTERYELAAAKRVVPESMHNSLSLLPSELCLVKFCDKLEFAFSCYHEWMLGNRYAVPPMERTLIMARDAIPDDIFVSLPESVRHNINTVLNEAQRLLELMRGGKTPTKEISFAS